MAETNNTTPLWLDIKKEYIDTNFEKVLAYLQRMGGVRSKDAFYTDTLRLLEERVKDVMYELALEPMHIDFKDMDQNRAKFRTRLFGAYLLVLKQQGKTDAEILFAFFRSLSQLTNASLLQDLYTTAVSALTTGLGECPGLSWDGIIEFQPHILAHKILAAFTTHHGHKGKEKVYEKYGLLKIGADGIQIYPASATDLRFSAKGFSSSLKTAADAIQIFSRPDDKLKQSDSADYQKIDEFVHNIRNSQMQVKPSVNAAKHYSKGEIMDVRVVSISPFDVVLETVDPSYEKITAPLKEESAFYYGKRDFTKFLRVGDYLSAQLASDVHPEFSLLSTLCTFLTGGYVSAGEEYLAVARKITGSRITWWTKDGFPVYTPSEESEYIAEGEYGYIKITSVSNTGFIHADYIESTDETFDEDESKDTFVYNFVYDESYTPPVAKNVGENLSKELVDILCRFTFSYQKTIPQLIERYRCLAACRILATLTSDNSSRLYLNFVADYMQDLAFFAQGRYSEIKRLVPDIEFADQPAALSKINTVEVLMEYGKSEDSDLLTQIIESPSDAQLSRIAKLVQSCNRISDVVSGPMLNSIKREITKSLSVDGESDSDLDEDNGIYLGMEDRLHEFKTSFVYPPANGMMANVNVQSLNIFKGLCAFMNSEAGGTLYLGVSDLGYVVGVENDLDYLHKNHDGYIRFIQDEAKKFFDVGMIAHWDFKVLYDGKVVAINVRPYEIGVVELNGKAYVRLTGESVEMSDTMRKQLLSKRVFADKGKASNLSNLQIAIRERKQVILHNYSSSNSGKISDRTVEPFSLSADGTFVWCYEIGGEVNKVFSLARIEYVEILSQGWQYTTKHHEGTSDVFHTSGAKAIKVSLELDLMAKNLLCEEYPDAKKDITRTKDDNIWLFNTEVYKIEGLGRFYLGLAEHIRIINAPELLAYVKEYVKKNIL